ncbi:MAG: hypothetical protein QOK37_4001 [Thermoanaerobaculia bacterium]|jgi:hypothetical protein|nr:hypothetical protein [Thermoanaerobaculia bacterium]
MADVMNQKMTKAMAQEWRARWRIVEDRQREELRKETYEERFRALAFLMASCDLFDFTLLDREDEVARERWARLQSTAVAR